MLLKLNYCDDVNVIVKRKSFFRTGSDLNRVETKIHENNQMMLL